MHNQRSIYGGMLQECAVNRLRDLNEERTKRIDALKDRSDAENYVKEVRSRVQSCFNMPSDRSIPKVELCGTVEREKFKIEKLIYFSRENYPVTANLYVPNTPGKHPGVVFVCGHSNDGKACETYQRGAQNLALQGYVVLLIDPVSQGERWQFVDVPHAQGIHGACTSEHSMMGKQLRLAGEYLGAWRAYDALRGLDYLLSRSEVDPGRIGITGNSGGGTMTTFVQALDSRFTMAAPSCYVTSWQRNIENELPADVEQIPPGILAAGCEMGDFVLAYAPRPVLLLGQKNDFFDPRGLKDTFEECRKVYALLGAEENLKLFIGPTNHGYSVENRKSMYSFFAEHAGTRAVEKEVSLDDVPEKELWCAPGGQVDNMPDKKLIHDLIVEMLDDFAAKRSKLDLAGLKKLLVEKYDLPVDSPVPYCRSLRPWFSNPGKPEQEIFSRFAIESEPGILVPLLLRGNKLGDCNYIPALEEVTLYVPHLSATGELSGAGVENAVIGVDVRGIGTARSFNCDFFSRNDFFHPYGEDYHYNSCAIMFNSSTLAERIKDLLSAIAYVKSCGIKKIRLAGRGQGAVVALFTAVLSDDVVSLKLFDAPESFDAMARAGITLWPHAVMPRGILKYTDLPDMYSALTAAGKLQIVNFADQLFRTARV